MFGKRTTPPGTTLPRATPDFPSAPIDSDGKRRVFGEAVFAGPHGDMLRMLGFGLDDPHNVIPDSADFDRMVQDSVARQEMRRQRIEADLLAGHGHNAIRPFFILAGPVFEGSLGPWLIRMMRLMPYDEWNIVYLPTDRATQVAMGGLPLHPLQSVAPIDDLMVEQIGQFHARFVEAKRMVDARVSEVGFSAAKPVLDAFVTYVDGLPKCILEHVAKVRPMLVGILAELQHEAA